MLSEISCEHFKQKKISFKSGLNVILGDDKGINSIGKSTALMVVDFVFGGNSFLDHNAGAVREYGAHSYEFCFIFENLNYYFSRNTLSPDEVSICDQNYKLIKNISIDAYTALLKDKYKLIGSVGSFRSLVNTYARIWGKSNYDIVKPLSSFPKQADAIAVTNLIDLFEHLSSILDAKTKAEKEIERFKILRKSIKLEFIPKVTKTQHKENIQKIVEIDLELQKI